MVSYFGIDCCIACFKSLIRNEVPVFEKEFAEYIGTKYAIGTSYGRTALYLGLKAVGVEGKEVILPAFTCTVVKHAVRLSGAIPRFVEVTLPSYEFDIEDLISKINPLTKAIVITHYFGNVAKNLDEIVTLGRKKGLTVIEDCAHSLGAEYKDKKIGTYGDFSIFSMTKGLVNFGGGVLVTDDNSLYSKAIRIMKNESPGIKKSIADFPLVFAYGLEQMIDKLMFDRIGKSIFKYWILKLPNILIKPRVLLVYLLKTPIFFIKALKSKKEKSVAESGKEIKRNNLITNTYQLTMCPIIASAGRSQLKVIDSLIAMRKKIHGRIINALGAASPDNKEHEIKKVYTNIVLKIEKGELEEVVDHFKKRGILLRKTWPTHQKLEAEQQTGAVIYIKDNVVTLNINPQVKECEIKRVADTALNSPLKINLYSEE